MPAGELATAVVATTGTVDETSRAAVDFSATAHDNDDTVTLVAGDHRSGLLQGQAGPGGGAWAGVKLDRSFLVVTACA